MSDARERGGAASGDPGGGTPGAGGVSGASAGGDVTALSHVAIAVREADALVATLTTGLGGTLAGEELLDGGALRVVFVRLGPVTFELLEPRAADHTVAKFLDTRGPGLHHVSLEVADLRQTLERCRAAGLRSIDEAPRRGAHGTEVAFLHPRDLGGVLVELCQSMRRKR